MICIAGSFYIVSEPRPRITDYFDSADAWQANLTLPWSRNHRNPLTRSMFSGRFPRILGFLGGELLAIVAVLQSCYRTVVAFLAKNV